MLFEVDTAGDASIRQQLEGEAQEPKAKKRKKGKPEQRALLAQERELASLVFNDVPGAEPPVMQSDDDADSGSDVGEIDKDERNSDRDHDGSAHASKPAWVDEDDEEQLIDLSVPAQKGKSRLQKLRKSRAQTALGGLEYAESLRRQFESVQPKVSWAALPKPKRSRQHARFDDDGKMVPVASEAGTDGRTGEGETSGEEQEDTDAILRSGQAVLQSAVALPPTVLSVRRLSDLNQKERSSSLTPCVQWHPNGRLALTAGPDKTLRLFRTDGGENPKLQGVHLPKLPIDSAAFTHDGSQILMCGRGKHWAIFDLHSGTVQTVPGITGRNDRAFTSVLPSPAGDVIAMTADSGAVMLISAASKQLIATLQPGAAGKFGTQCARFSPDGNLLHTSADGATVRVWDVRRRCCVHTWSDSGGLRCTALAASPDGAYMAAGSDSGAVNVYHSREVLRATRPKPVKEYLNLTSAVTTVEFNPTSEVLVFASKYVKRAMRAVHVAGQHVFANWPTSKSPLNYVQCAAFSPHSGHMAIGTDQGKVLLYQLNHYASM